MISAINSFLCSPLLSQKCLGLAPSVRNVTLLCHCLEDVKTQETVVSYCHLDILRLGHIFSHKVMVRKHMLCQLCLQMKELSFGLFVAKELCLQPPL